MKAIILYQIENQKELLYKCICIYIYISPYCVTGNIKSEMSQFSSVTKMWRCMLLEDAWVKANVFCSRLFISFTWLPTSPTTGSKFKPHLVLLPTYIDIFLGFDIFYLHLALCCILFFVYSNKRHFAFSLASNP